MAGQTVTISVLADTGRFSRAMSGLSTVGKRAMAGVAAATAIAGVGLAKLAKASIASASNLQQSTGAVDAVFQKQAASVHKWAKSAWKDLGLSEDAYNSAASLIGSQLKNMGVPMSGLGTQTSLLIKKGADLAAQFGGTTASAVEALSALLRGETDPIEKYGVSIKEVDIKAQMAADGTAKLTGAQGKAARTAAIMTLLNRQTASAMGANAREAATWEGVTQRLAGWWDNLKAKLGTPLITVLSALVAKFTALADRLTQTTQFQAFIAWLTTLGQSLAASASDANSLAGQALTLARSFTPLGILIRALTPILPQLGAAFASIGKVMSGTLATVLPTLLPSINTLATALGTVLANALPVVVELVGVLAQVFAQVAPPIAGLVTTLVGALAPILVKLSPIIALLARTFGQVLMAVMPAVIAIIGAVTQVISALIPVLMPIIDLVAQIVQAAAPILVMLGQLIGAILPPLIAIIVQVVQVVVGALTPVFKALLPVLGGPLLAFSRLSSAGGKMASTIQSAVSRIGRAFNGVKNLILKALGDPLGTLKAFGTNIVQGLFNGITAANQWLKDKIVGWVGNVQDWFKKAFGINSPARIMLPVGGALPEGMGVGFDRRFGAFLAKVKAAAGATVAAFRPDLSTSVDGWRMPTAQASSWPASSSTTTAPQTVINLTVNGALDANAVARQILDILTRYLRMRGNLTVNGLVFR